MSRLRWMVPVAVALAAVALPALAGGDETCSGDKAKEVAKIASSSSSKGHSCTASTQECLDYMSANYRNKGWVGIELDKEEESRTMTVRRVIPDSPAQAAGFKPGDVLVALNGVRLSEQNEEEMHAAYKKMIVGQKVTYTVDRNGIKNDLHVVLGKVPEDVLAQWVGAHMLEHAHGDEADQLAKK